jgi:antitoxin component YwqK of YwqJK toxin-antitoxin module
MKDGLFTTYYESGGLFEETKYRHGTPKFKRVYREDGTLVDKKGFFDKKVIKRIVG